PARAAPSSPSPSGPGRPFRVALDVLQSDSHDSAPALFERGQVARRLRPDQPSEAELPPRDRDLAAGVVDDLDEEAGVRAALVQLPRRVEIARAETVRHDAAALVRACDQRRKLGLASRVDERLDAD